jgi:hypothetical protein
MLWALEDARDEGDGSTANAQMHTSDGTWGLHSASRPVDATGIRNVVRLDDWLGSCCRVPA